MAFSRLLIVNLNCLIVSVPIEEYISIANKEFNGFIKGNHILVPEDTPINFLPIGVPNDYEAKGERIESVAFDLAGAALLIIPAVDKPLVPAEGVIHVSQSGNVEIDRVALLNHLLIDMDGLHYLTVLEQPISHQLHCFEIDSASVSARL
jgi:hypothetical protein